MNIKDTVENITDAQTKLQKAREEHRERAAKIAHDMCFSIESEKRSSSAKSALQVIDQLFKDFTEQVCLFIPAEPRSHMCLDCIEQAHMWLRKAVLAFDRKVLDQIMENTNGNSSDGSETRESESSAHEREQ